MRPTVGVGKWIGRISVFVSATEDAVADGLAQLLAQGAQVIALAGSRAMDPLDPAFEALQRVGARMERHGVPAHPGSLVWLARAGAASIIGMPACGLFSQASVFDLLLPRLLTGHHLGHPEVQCRSFTRLCIEAEVPLPLAADGEAMAAASRVEVLVLPRALKVVVAG